MVKVEYNYGNHLNSKVVYEIKIFLLNDVNYVWSLGRANKVQGER